MSIDPTRRTAMITAINALNSASMLQEQLDRQALAGAIITASMDLATTMNTTTIEQCLSELDHIISSAGFVAHGTRTVRGCTLTALLAAIA